MGPDMTTTPIEALRLAERALVSAYGEPVEGATMQGALGVQAITAVRAVLAKPAPPEPFDALRDARREIVHLLRGNETLARMNAAVMRIDAALRLADEGAEG